MSMTVAIVGRPNVGKSTLFNRLCRKKMAIIDDRPGVTRDWREGVGDLFGLELRLLDTAGLEDRFDGSLEARMRKQTERALDQADVILFVVDGRDGITPMDEHFAGWLRTQKKPMILAVNKCDHQGIADTSVGEAYRLGFGEAVALSSAHNLGFDDLYQVLRHHEPAKVIDVVDPDEADDGPAADLPADLDELEGREDFDFIAQAGLDIVDDEKPIKVAIVGRPNGGKSTLMNALLGEERVMTGPEAGITRDAIAAAWMWQGRKFRLVDTAGLRKRSRIVDPLEQQSAADSLRAIRLAHVVFLVIDATLGLEGQDLKIAQHVVDEGRVLIVVLNKWDLVADRQTLRTEVQDKIARSLGQLVDVPVVAISALEGRHLDQLMKVAVDLFTGWRTRVGTAALNRWLLGAASHHPPPLVKGRPNAIKYITQINVKPPTFALWVTHPDALPDAYRRYLINGLRERFAVPPVPIRIMLRKSKNPYAQSL
jgi:GTP-binding protein